VKWGKNKTKIGFVGNQKCLFLPPLRGIVGFWEGVILGFCVCFVMNAGAQSQNPEISNQQIDTPP
jgi:hypothetical protein